MQMIKQDVHFFLQSIFLQILQILLHPTHFAKFYFHFHLLQSIF